MTEIIERNTEETAARRSDIAQRLKSTLIERLSLQVTPADIGDDMALFGAGLITVAAWLVATRSPRNRRRSREERVRLRALRAAARRGQLVTRGPAAGTRKD